MNKTISIIRRIIAVAIMLPLYFLSAIVPLWLSITAIKGWWPALWLSHQTLACELAILAGCALWWLGYWALTFDKSER